MVGARGRGLLALELCSFLLGKVSALQLGTRSFNKHSNRRALVSPLLAAREGVAATRVRAYFEAWNARDMELACEQWAEDCTYDDTQYPDAFVGKAALRSHLLKVAAALPESFAFVVDELADGGSVVGVQWHVESGGAPLPFTRGCSVYKCETGSLLTSGFDVPEPAPLKPGSAGLALLSVASKFISEPVRVLPAAVCAIYCWQLFFAEGQLLPGPGALQLDAATWVEVRDLSLNFWQIGPALAPGQFPVLHPGLEGIFNVVLAWSALFAGFLADGREPRKPMLPTVLGMQLLTNAFFLTYLATRDSEKEEDVALSDLSQLEQLCESRALPALLGSVGAFSIAWACLARPEFGGLEERLNSLQQLLANDRLGSSFVIDLGLYSLFQGWLVPDDLKRRGVQDKEKIVYQLLTIIPFFGLAAYLAIRPPLPPSRT